MKLVKFLAITFAMTCAIIHLFGKITFENSKVLTIIGIVGWVLYAPTVAVWIISLFADFGRWIKSFLKVT